MFLIDAVSCIILQMAYILILHIAYFYKTVPWNMCKSASDDTTYRTVSIIM